MTPEELKAQKDIQFYGASVNAWINTSLEQDKSLLTLSAGGIGLLIALLTTIGIAEVALLVLYVLAIVAFSVCLIFVLYIFSRNRKHVEKVLAGNPAADPSLGTADYAAMAAFLAGALLTGIIGITMAVSVYQSKKEQKMAEESKPAVTTGTVNRSFNNLGALQQAIGGSGPTTGQGTAAGSAAPQGSGAAATTGTATGPTGAGAATSQPVKP